MIRGWTAAVALGLISSCSSPGEASWRAAPGQLTGSSCSDPNYVLTSTKRQPVDIGDISSELGFLTHRGDFRLDQIESVTGPCARLVNKANAANYQLSNGVTIGVSTQGSHVHESGLDLSMPYLASLPRLNLDGADLVMAAGLSGAPAGPYVGLFRRDDKSILATFHRCQDGRFTSPSSVFSSDRPIKTITALPGYHAPWADVVAVIKTESSGPVLVNFDWFYTGSGQTESCGIKEDS